MNYKNKENKWANNSLVSHSLIDIGAVSVSVLDFYSDVWIFCVVVFVCAFDCWNQFVSKAPSHDRSIHTYTYIDIELEYFYIVFIILTSFAVFVMFIVVMYLPFGAHILFLISTYSRTHTLRGTSKWTFVLVYNGKQRYIITISFFSFCFCSLVCLVLCSVFLSSG